MVPQIITAVAMTTISFSTQSEEPYSVGLENMAKRLQGDVRLIAMGDSYSAPFFARIPLSGLCVWPIEKISAICSGAALGSNTFTCIPHCTPTTLIQSKDDLGYTVERSSSESYFTLPVFGIQEIYTSKTFDDEGQNRLFTFQLDGAGITNLANGNHGPFAESGDDLMFRFLYRCPSDIEQQVEQIKVFDFSEEVGVMHLRDKARPFWHMNEDPTDGTREPVPKQINAYSVDFPAHNDVGGQMRMTLEQLKPLAGTNRYFEPAGSVYYQQNKSGMREHGLYFSYVSDASWSYYGFGCDTEGTSTHDKKFSQSQFTHWLDVTTLDRNQPIVFMWYLAPEPLTYDASLSLMTNMIAQAEASSNLVGITSVEHLIVIAPLFRLNNNTNTSREYIRNQQQAAFDLAGSTSNISAASIFSITDEVLFDGIGGVPWLLYRGFDNFEFGTNTINLVEETGGDLFDPWVIHPGSANSAAFFTSLLGEIIREAGCKADVIVDGLINTTDLLSVIDHIGGEYVEEDINEDGIVDIQDLLLVIDGWGDCWPVQAPYNTPTFRLH